MGTPALRISVVVHFALLALLVVVPRGWPVWLAVFLALHAILAGFGLHPRSRALGPNISRLPPHAAARGWVALTFDDGPHPGITPQVLDLLDRHGARASFFCIGHRARQAPDVVQQIVRRGHSVENHTDRHKPYFPLLPSPQIRRELHRAQTTLAMLAGQAPRWFRAPQGVRSPLLQPALAREDLQLVSWSRRGLDGISNDPAAVLRRLTAQLAAGDILLLHDHRDVVLDVLPALLNTLAARGLQAVSLPIAFDPRR